MNLVKAVNYGRLTSDSQNLYPECNEKEWAKTQYTYWIIPWNPMGTSNLLYTFVDWAFNKFR